MKHITKAVVGLAAAGALALGVAVPASAYVPDTATPGQQKKTSGPVTGHYTLEQDGCDYVVNYRGDFGGDPYLDSGWIMNQITCDDGSVESYLIVSSDDQRYTGNPDMAIWGSWEIVKYTVKGEGNQANPNRPVKG